MYFNRAHIRILGCISVAAITIAMICTGAPYAYKFATSALIAIVIISVI